MFVLNPLYPFFKNKVPPRGGIGFVAEYLSRIESDANPKAYVISSFLSALLLTLPFAFLSFHFLGMIRPTILLIFLLLFLFNLFHPYLKYRTLITEFDKSAKYVATTLYILLDGGLSVYDAFVMLSKARTLPSHIVFERIVRKVNAGGDLEKAIEETLSQFPESKLSFLLEMVNENLKTTTELLFVVKNIKESYEKEEQMYISSFLNFLSVITLAFMMIVIVVPVITITFLFILSTMPFGGLELTTETLYLIIISVTVIGIFIIGLVKYKLPILIGE